PREGGSGPLPFERSSPRRHLVENGAEREKVRADVHLRAARLLRGHVGDGPVEPSSPGAGRRLVVRGAGDLRAAARPRGWSGAARGRRAPAGGARRGGARCGGSSPAPRESP